jgi:hypothetical protein
LSKKIFLLYLEYKGNNIKKIFIGIFVILFLTLIVSCDGVSAIGVGLEKVYVNFDYDKFKNEEALWNSTKPANYQFNLAYSFYGIPSVNAKTLIIVENGKYKTQIPIYTNDETGYTSRSYRNETINDIYEYIEKEYLKFNNKRSGFRSSYLYEIEINYDIKNHIPIEVKMWYINPAVFLDSSAYEDNINITEYKINN